MKESKEDREKETKQKRKRERQIEIYKDSQRDGQRQTDRH